MKKLNLGCGDDYKEGWINLDIDRQQKADVYHNLKKFPYPFKNNYFDYILANHILEHLEKPLKVIEELARICKDNGIIHIEMPYSTNLAVYSFYHIKGTGGAYSHTLSNWMLEHEIKSKKIIIKKVWVEFSRNKVLKLLNYPINKFLKYYERFFCFILPSQYIHFELIVNNKK